MGVVMLAAPANVIMQLGLPGVGYGVMESRVNGGRIDRHPVKRGRTTLTYLAVATRGTANRRPRSARPSTAARAGVLHQGESGEVQRLQQGSPIVGRRLPLQGAASTSTAPSSGRWTTRPPTGTLSDRGQGEGHHSAGARGNVAGRRAAFEQYWRSRWTRSTSTTRCANTSIPSRSTGWPSPTPRAAAAPTKSSGCS